MVGMNLILPIQMAVSHQLGAVRGGKYKNKFEKDLF